MSGGWNFDAYRSVLRPTLYEAQILLIKFIESSEQYKN